MYDFVIYSANKNQMKVNFGLYIILYSTNSTCPSSPDIMLRRPSSAFILFGVY